MRRNRPQNAESSFDRRTFLAVAAAAPFAFSARASSPSDDAKKDEPKKAARTFSISLAQWSFHKAIKKGEMDPLDFASRAAKDFGIRAIEYVNQFYFGKIATDGYVRSMKQRADDNGVKSQLIMCDGEGMLGDSDKGKREAAITNHHKWADAAAYLGCHSIRVNAMGDGKPDDVQKRVAESLHVLADYCGARNLNLIVENHGSYSSDGKWVADLMKLADHPRVGTLPDFGNFKRDDGTYADRYEGVRLMMPYAKAVSAKSYEFDDKGEEVRTDYHKMMKIVLDAGYTDHLGIEYEGDKHSEPEGIRLTKALLEKIRAEGT